MASTLGLQPVAQQRPSVKADTMSRILSDMCRPGTISFLQSSDSHQTILTLQLSPIITHTGVLERGEDHILRDFVDAESRSSSGERFNRFVSELFSRVKALVQRYTIHARCPLPLTP